MPKQNIVLRKPSIKTKVEPGEDVNSLLPENIKELVMLLLEQGNDVFLRALLVSQADIHWRQFLIYVLNNFMELSQKKNSMEAVEVWQNRPPKVSFNNYETLFNKEEWKIMKRYRLVLDDQPIKDKDQQLIFNDILSNHYYSGRLPIDAVLRRLVIKSLKQADKMTAYQRLVLYFIVSQLLDNWHAPMMLLAQMVLAEWDIQDMSDFFCSIFFVYTV